MTLVGTMGAAIVYFVAGDAPAGLRAIAMMVIVLMPLTVAAALWTVPEPKDYTRQRLNVGRAMRAIGGNALFRRLLGAYFINGLANGLPPTLFLFFVGDLLGAKDADWLLMVYFGCAVMGLPIWAWAARTFSKHRAWSVAMVIALIIFAPAVMLGEGDLMIFTAICVATGLTLGADLSLPASIQADVVDKDTAETGEQRTGLFFALWSVATKAALAIASGIALLTLDFAGFASGGENTPGALLTLAILYTVAPAALKLCAVALMWNFPLGPEEQKALRMQIEATT
jgi:Na+/melibiose symporter-like transporter